MAAAHANSRDALLCAVTYLEWWRDGTIADAELPDDIDAVIAALQQRATGERRKLGWWGSLRLLVCYVLFPPHPSTTVEQSTAHVDQPIVGRDADKCAECGHMRAEHNLAPGCVGKSVSPFCQCRSFKLQLSD
jgi:hypothetical protein